MGMPVTATVRDPGFEPSGLDTAFAELRAVDERFSTYRADSEVARIARGELPPQGASPLVREVLARCEALRNETGGAFDARAGGALDPSGYVKGWSVQVASDRLLEAGAPNHCLNAGGDIRLRGLSTAGRPWRVGVRHPWNPRATCTVIGGTDLAIATSGVYERGHHVIDPRKGTPARGLRSVTVVGPDLGTADAYATAAIAMGASGARWVGRRIGYTCAVVTDDGRFLRSPALPVT